MGYTKQNFTDGQILEAEHLNHIENGIDQLSGEIADLDTVVFGKKTAISKKDFEQGSINSGNGTNVDTDLICIRTKDKKNYSNKIIVTNKNTALYRVKYYVYNLDGSFVRADANWYAESSFEFIPDTNYIYRFQIATRDGSNIDLNDAVENVLFNYESYGEGIDEKVDKLLTLSTDVEMLKEKVLKIQKPITTDSFEYGSINTGNGTNVDGDLICVRTKEAKTYLSQIKITNSNPSLYRVKFFVYNEDGTFNHADQGWYAVDTFTITPEGGYLYRFQIATIGGVQISLEDAMENVHFVYIGEATEETDAGVDITDKYLLVNGLNSAKTIDAIPSYWESYLDSKIEAIREELRNGKDKSCFMLLTDTHYYGRDLHNINGAILKYVASKTNCSRVLHLGDLNSENGTPSTAVDFMQEPIRILRESFENVLVVRGNHDDNQEGSRGWNDSRITQSDSYSYMFRGLKAEFGETNTYYYQDDTAEKIRFIALDNTDISYDSESTWEKLLAFRKNQLEWLCDTLKTTPNGYSIVILLHSMLAPSNVTIENPSKVVQTRASNYIAVCEILKAYKNRISDFSHTLDGSFSLYNSDDYSGNISCDFSSCTGNIVGVFSGHEHVDCIEEILGADGNGIGIYNTCTQNSSTPFPDSVISSSYQASMEMGTITEYIYDFVIVDKTTHAVKMIRLGAGNEESREFFYL